MWKINRFKIITKAQGEFFLTLTLVLCVLKLLKLFSLNLSFNCPKTNETLLCSVAAVDLGPLGASLRSAEDHPVAPAGTPNFSWDAEIPPSAVFRSFAVKLRGVFPRLLKSDKSHDSFSHSCAVVR